MVCRAPAVVSTLNAYVIGVVAEKLTGTVTPVLAIAAALLVAALFAATGIYHSTLSCRVALRGLSTHLTISNPALTKIWVTIQTRVRSAFVVVATRCASATDAASVIAGL